MIPLKTHLPLKSLAPFKTHSSFKALAIGTLAALTLSQSVQAQPKADINQDGQVTQAEFMSQSDERFRLTDSNHDGLLSKEERNNARNTMQAAKKVEQFTRLDTNSDGVLTQSEFSAKPQRGEGERPGFMGGGPDHMAGADAAGNDDETAKSERKRRGFMKRGKHHNMKKHWKKADADNDGFISRAEYDAQAQTMFTRLDRNKDGVLSQDDHRRGKKTNR